MKTKKEVEARLKELEDELESRRPKPSRCPTCGQSNYIGTWTLFDSWYFTERIKALRWVLTGSEFIEKDEAK